MSRLVHMDLGTQIKLRSYLLISVAMPPRALVSVDRYRHRAARYRRLECEFRIQQPPSLELESIWSARLNGILSRNRPTPKRHMLKTLCIGHWAIEPP